MCECCHYVFTISRLSRPTNVAVWYTVIENGVTPTQIRQRSNWKKKKERKLYKCSVEHFFPLLIVHQKLADLDKKIPLRRLFFWPRKDFVYFILFFFFLRKIQMKGVNVWSNCTMWFPLSWVQVSDPYIKVPIIDLCFCFW